MGNAYDNASLIVTPNAYKASKIYALKPTDGSGDLSFSRAGSKMVRNSSGLWETIGTNIPPLHYPVGGGCPSWLLEPAATNLCTRSYQLSSWNNPSGNAITDNVSESPISGYLASQINFVNTSYAYLYPALFTIANSTTYSISFFIKNNTFATGETVRVTLTNNKLAPNNVEFRISVNPFDKTISFSTLGTITTGYVSAGTGSITDLGNGWLYCTGLITIGSGGGTASTSLEVVAINTPKSCYMTGVQVETGSAATSPIITAGSSMTRLADAAEGNSQITSTDFTWFIDFKSMVATLGGGQYFGLTENGTNYGIWLFTATIGSSFIRAFTWTSSGLYEFLISRGNANNAKIAFVKSGLQIKTFINGVLSQTSTIPVQIPIPTKIKRLLFVNNELNETITYQTALSDSEAIELTTL